MYSFVLRNEIDINLINFKLLSSNPCISAINLLSKNLDKVCWSRLSANPNAIELLKENQDKIDWFILSSNPNAIDILKENLDIIDESNFSVNLFFEKYRGTEAIKILSI